MACKIALQVKLHAWLSAALLLLVGRPSLAASASVDVSPECGSHAEFDAEVRRRLNDDAVLAKTSVLLRRDGETYALRVEIGDEVRALRDADCRELFRAAVVVTVAVAVSEGAQRKEPEPEPAPEAGTKGAAPVAKARTPEPSARERSEPERPELERTSIGPSLAASLGAGLSAGVLPNPVFALELEARTEWKFLGLAAGARFVAPTEERDPNQYGVKVWGLGGHVVGLARPLSFLELRLGFAAYRLSGKGIGSPAPRDGGVWVAGPAVGLALIPLELPALWLAVGGEVHADLVRSNFEILNYGVVFEVPRFGTAAFLRVGRRFF